MSSFDDYPKYTIHEPAKGRLDLNLRWDGVNGEVIEMDVKVVATRRNRRFGWQANVTVKEGVCTGSADSSYLDVTCEYIEYSSKDNFVSLTAAMSNASRFYEVDQWDSGTARFYAHDYWNEWDGETATNIC